MKRTVFSAMVSGVALAALVSLPALAAPGKGGPKASPKYDPKTEVTVTGTVEEVKEMNNPGIKHPGQHLTLKTDSGTLEVHLGPADYLKAQGLELAKGDSITVTGSKVKMGEKDTLIAREVKKGDKVVTLRNAQGMPAWAKGRKSS